MKTPLALALLGVLAFVALPATAADRACRPSLSNFYHCPDTSPSATKAKTPELSDRSDTRSRKAASTSRACRPSLSNGYSCPPNSAPAKPDSGTSDNAERPARRTASAPDRACRPSLSNGYKCPGASGPPDRTTADYQYTTEAQARSRCPTDTVVWVNTRSNIYHFSGTRNYGNTIAGAYMCEGDTRSEGMRAAKNETHP
jgi:hypothetical protein